MGLLAPPVARQTFSAGPGFQETSCDPFQTLPRFTVPSKTHGSKTADAEVWDINNSKLSVVPEHFVLERTSTFVGNCRASVVAARIADCLRKRSIQSHFNSAKAKVKCFTQQYVEFRVRLFAGKEECDHGVIVEVQRRSGSVVHFRDDYRAICDAAKGIQEDYIPIPKWSIGSLKDESLPCQDSSMESIELACQLLKEDRLDANLLGIQSLALLTDADKCGPNAALLASKEIVSHSEQADLRNIIASLIETGVMDPDENGPLNKANGIFFNLRANSFITLCNALKVCAKDGSLFQSIVQQPWYMDILVPILTKELKNAETSPLMALLSVRCLNILVENSVDCRSKALDIGALGALENARKFGRARYASLATETERGVAILEYAC